MTIFVFPKVPILIKKYSLILILFSFHMLATAQTSRLEIAVPLHDGLGKGTSEYAMNSLSFIDNWTEVRLVVEFLNQPQFIYQHTKAGHFADGYVQSTGLEIAQITETPICCYLFLQMRLIRKGPGGLYSMTFEKGCKEVRVVYDAYIKDEIVS